MDAALIIQGRRRLRDLLPWARAEAAKRDAQVTLESALGKATAPYVTEDNLRALVIYPAPLGGWHADALFKRVPPGVPDTIGTPVGSPCKTRAEAEEFGKRLLVSMLVLAEQNRSGQIPKRDPAFLLDGWTIPLVSKIYESALAIMPQYRDGYGSKERAAEHVAETLAELCPDGFDGKAFNDWGTERKAKLLAVVHIAALSGLYAYPMRQDATPSGHKAPSDVRH